MGQPHRLRLKVRHYEVDVYGHVNHAHYVHYLETGRIEALEAIGLSIGEMKQQGRRQIAARLLVTSMAESKPKPTRAMLPARNPAARSGLL